MNYRQTHYAMSSKERKPLRFPHPDRCWWAKDAGRRSERTCSFVEGTTLHSNDDFSSGVAFSDPKKLPGPTGSGSSGIG
jgi:hypothetical protein